MATDRELHSGKARTTARQAEAGSIANGSDDEGEIAAALMENGSGRNDTES